ncbi:FUSC family protein [Pseudochryseolinea flava]|uniref:Integral membrane protein YccS N-terminal domain-containing protein n=1 Tax=Pseudochryseolinea flava TaxID=2059302 RepID=A0A364XYT4_9BACT|nr:FUSC family membrane protein [Pseudochryseolinea flava]RAV99443.1 hypothetical protein DQQ10_19685 [Pseudochryseolinea flava]
MVSGRDYLREVQKFTTSQYWSTGLRITAGVMLPTFIMARMDWLTLGMPFLWGALFVSITDMPGPIHQRRNGMLAAIALNTIVVFITILIRDYPALLLLGVTLFSFSLALLGIYGARAGAVGTLALVIMLLNFVSRYDEEQFLLREVALVAGGGLWYTMLSLMLYRLRPYRLAEQAIGENLITIADYVKARGSLYGQNANLHDCFRRIMLAQVEVRRTEEQTRDLLFKTRQFVADASPKSRSMMMLFLDAMDLFESSLKSHQQYESLHKNLKDSEILVKIHGVILQLAAEIEHAGFRIQSGVAIKKNIDLSSNLSAIEVLIKSPQYDLSAADVHALLGTLENIRFMANGLQRLVLYSRNEVDISKATSSIEEVAKQVSAQPIDWDTLRENLTLSSNHFRYALRLTLALIVGYLLSSLLSLSHTYWVLLTILTILKPIYTQSRKRNIERLSGTFFGAFLALGMLAVVTNTAILLVVMILCMLLAYSFLRVNYFTFVFFLTLFIIITFHFLNPGEISHLVKERVIDTLIGSVIAAIAARFILPLWEHEQIEASLAEMIAANRQYFHDVWTASTSDEHGHLTGRPQSRSKAIVALANLSDKFQAMLVEPGQNGNSVAIHQLVIANHMLTGHIAAIPTGLPKSAFANDHLDQLALAIEQELTHAENQLLHKSTPSDKMPIKVSNTITQSANPLGIVYALAHDLRRICQRMQT